MSRIKYSIKRKIDEIEGKTPENDMQTDKEKKHLYDLHIYIKLVHIYSKENGKYSAFFSCFSHIIGSET